MKTSAELLREAATLETEIKRTREAGLCMGTPLGRLVKIDQINGSYHPGPPTREGAQSPYYYGFWVEKAFLGCREILEQKLTFMLDGKKTTIIRKRLSGFSLEKKLSVGETDFIIDHRGTQEFFRASNKNDIEHSHDIYEGNVKDLRQKAARAKTDEDEAAAMITITNEKLEDERRTRLALHQARLSMELRILQCSFDNWATHPEEPYIYLLPREWWPLRMVGLVDANVTPYGQSPPAEVFDPRGDGGYRRIGGQNTPLKGIYLIGLEHQTTITYLVVDIETLRGTTSGDKLLFVASETKNILYIINRTRGEMHPNLFEYNGLEHEEAERKFALIKPFMDKLYRHVLIDGDWQHGGSS